MQKLSQFTTILLTTTALGCSIAFSQEPSVTLLDTLRIESDEAQSLLGNEEVTEEDLENRNPAAIDDVFAGESSVTASGGAAIGQKIFVNGIEESLLSVTIDGARQNKSAFHHTGNVLIDPELLKRVDISEGIAPADAGPGALAGLISYETKDVGDLLADGRNYGGLLTAMTDTNGTDQRSTLTVFGREETGFEWLFSGASHTGNDYDDANGVVVPGTEPDLTNFLGKLAHEADTGERLELSASRTEDNGTCAAQAGPGGIVFCRPDFAGVVGRPNVFTDRLSRRDSVTLTYTDEQPEDNWDPTFQVSYNSQEIDVSGVAGTNESVSAVFKNRWSYEDGSLTAGVDYLHETAEGQGFGPGPFGSSGEEFLRNFGIFTQIRQDLTDRVSISAGARFDSQRFEAATGQDFSSSGFSANGAIDIQLTDTVAFTGGAATSWGGYELGEAALINFGGAWNYNGFTTSRANNYRAGLRYENDGWSLSGAYFYTEINDINAVLPRFGARGAQSDLVSAGVDASLSYENEEGFFKVNYTYADVTLNSNQVSTTAYYLGRPLGHIIALEAAYDVTDELRIGGNGQIALDNNEGPVNLEGYEVFNGYLSYKPDLFDNNVEFRLDVKNIFDETYQLRSSDGIGAANVIALNEPGRTFQFTTKIRF